MQSRAKSSKSGSGFMARLQAFFNLATRWISRSCLNKPLHQPRHKRVGCCDGEVRTLLGAHQRTCAHAMLAGLALALEMAVCAVCTMKACTNFRSRLCNDELAAIALRSLVALMRCPWPAA